MLAVAVVAVALVAAGWSALTYRRRREPAPLLAHLIALAQTLLVAQVGLGLLPPTSRSSTTAGCRTA